MSQKLYGSKLRFSAIKISTDDSTSQDFEVLRKRMALKENTVPCMIDKIKQGVKDMSRIMEELNSASLLASFLASLLASLLENL